MVDNEPGLDLSGMREMKRYANVPPGIMEFLREIYGDEINEIDVLLPGEKIKRATSLLNGFFIHASDSGLAREVEFYPPDGTVDSAGPVLMLSRRALISKVLKEIMPEGKYNGKPLVLAMIDIANVRGADFPVEKGDRAADWMLNKVAEVINETLKSVLSQKEKGIKCLVGRYGGDEFLLAIIGGNSDENQQLLNTFEQALKEKLGEIKGYFKKDDVIVREPVNLKEGRINQINFPDGEIEKNIFLHFFQRGLILEGDQIGRVIDKFRDEKGEIDRERLDNELLSQKPPSIYPEGVDVDNIEAKIDYLTRHHPELSAPFMLARYLDEEGKSLGQPATKRREALLSFVERVIFDPLLGEVVYGRGDLIEHLKRKRGEFKEVTVFELKFMKERNELLSYADTDEAIADLWGKIKSCISEEDREKIIVFRQGGSFILGIKGDLSEETRNRLNQLAQDQQIPIGYAKREIAFLEETEKEKEQKAKTLIGELIDDSDRIFFIQVINLIKENPQLREILEGPNPPPKTEAVSLEELLWHYFRGKRAKEHCGKILEVLKDKRFSGEEYDLIGQLFNQIISRS